ncbi:MAG TPA: hypothetical protein VFY71_01520, partial [Planctomycetota bacterium]|nr:hypothetical protein [Planctomycetota bacterium]
MPPCCRIHSLLGALLLAAAARAQDAAAAPAPATDPFAPLGREALLHDVDFSTDRRCEPVAIALQGPAGDRGRDVQWLLGWWARTLCETFEHVYAEPAGITPRAGREPLLVVAISNPRLFESLRAQLDVSDMRDERAFFAPALPGVVVLDPGGTDESPEMQSVVRPMLHAATHALLDARLPPDAAPPPAWLVEGLAERLSAHGVKPGTDDLVVRAQDEEALTALARAFVQRPQRVAMLRTLPELLGMDTLDGLEARAPDSGVPAHDLLHGLAHESSLFLAWLDEGVHSKPDRSALLVRAALTGQPCAPAVSAALGGADPAAVEADFVGWLKRQMNGVVRGVPFDQFTLQAPPLEAGELRQGLLAKPGLLAVPAGDPSVDRARALQLAADGELRAAAAQLEALAAAPGLPAADVAGVREERRLCLASDDLRSRWLAGRVGKSVDLLDGGAVVKLSLVSVAGDALVVRDKKAQRQVPASACLPGTLAAQYLAPGTTLSPADDEARAFAWLLAADLEWRAKTAPRLHKDP